MSLLAKVGSFVERNGTGTQAVTGVGFEPKVGIFWGNPGPTGANIRNGQFHYRVGWSDGTTHVAYAVNAGDVLAAQEEATTSVSNSRCFLGTSITAGGFFSPEVLGYGYIQSWDADGFTANFDYNFNNVNMDGQTWHYLLLGGADLEAKVGLFTYPTSGNVSVTGVGFQPRSVLAMYTPATSLGTGTGGDLSFGFATLCDTSQGTYAAFIKNVANPSSAHSYQTTDKFIARIDNTGSLTQEASLVSMDADGFTVNVSVGTSVLWNFYLALAGCAANLVSFNQPIATGTQTVSLTAYQPRAAFFVSTNKVTNTVGVVDTNVTMGACDDAIQKCAWTGDTSGSSPTGKTAFRINSTHAIECATSTSVGASTQTALASAALSTNLLTLDWTVVDTTAREIMAVIFADDFATGPCGLAPIPSGVTYPIRRVRVFPLPSENNLRMFLRRLELLLQAGVGLTTGQGSNPTFTVELSRDGGMTYGRAYVLTPGRLGEFTHRSILNQLGQYRNGTVRLAMSDPVLWAILEAFGDLETGTNWARG